MKYPSRFLNLTNLIQASLNFEWSNTREKSK